MGNGIGKSNITILFLIVTRGQSK